VQRRLGDHARHLGDRRDDAEPAAGLTEAEAAPLRATGAAVRVLG